MDQLRKNKVSIRGACTGEIPRDDLLAKVSQERELRSYASRANAAALFVQKLVMVVDPNLLLMKQGAEARVFEASFVGRRCVVKDRFSKKYRHPSLDSKLTLKRLYAEARCMTKARKIGVCAPVLYSVDPLLHTLTLEYVDGVSVKDVFLEFGSNGIIQGQLDDISSQIGNAIAKLHDGGLVHGDLTTSNLLIQKDTNQLVLIDFGLSFTSTLPEDKAVDLYVLERALLSMHSSCGNVMDRILAAYKKSSKQWSSTLNKLAQGCISSKP